MKNIFHNTLGIAIYAIVFGLFFSCNSQTTSSNLIVKEKSELNTRINTPQGFVRTTDSENSFASYLRSFPLKKHGEKVYLYNGNEKNRQDVHAAVLEISIGTKDLQQCADAVMRLRAEYLYKTKQYDKLHFNFTNGFNATYSKWMQGYRISIKGNKTKWYLATQPSTSRESFNAYLEIVFSYAGTLSLLKELKKKSLDLIEAGDVFLFGGSPGHAVMVMDVAVNVKTKERIFMLAQSYMPAQNIHILKNFNDSEISPWFKLKADEILKTPEWDFAANSLYSFE